MFATYTVILSTLEAVFFTYIAFLAGKLLLVRIYDGANSKPSVTLSVIIGFGLWACIGLVLGLLGIFESTWIYILILLLAYVCKDDIAHHAIIISKKDFWRKNAQEVITRVKKYPWSSLFIIVWIGLYALIAFSPTAMSKDGLAYHIPFAAEISERANISFPVMQDAEYGQLPLFGEILYAITLTLFNNITVLKLLQFVAYMLLILYVTSFIKRHTSDQTAPYFGFAISILLLACMPLARNALSGGMVDIWAFLFGTVSILLLIDSLLENNSDQNNPGKRNASIIIAGIALGLALGTKYFALFFAAIGVAEIVIILLVKKRKNLSNKLFFSEIGRTLILFALSAFIFGGFWYVKNLVLLGNPFYPIFAGGGGTAFTTEVNAFALERTWYNFFLFPFFIFGKETYHLPFGIFTSLSFALSYVGVLVLAFKKKLNLLLISVLIAMELYLGLIFMWSHQIRFIIPALIFNAILLVLIITPLKNVIVESGWKRTWNRKLILSLYSCMCILLFLGSIISFKAEFKCMLPANQLGCFQRIEGSAIYATEYINEHLRNTTVLEYWNVFYRYSLRHGNTYSHFSCGEENYDSILISDVNTADIGACLQAHNIVYYLDDTKSRENPWLRDEVTKLQTANYFISQGKVVFEHADPVHNTTIRLYSLVP